MKNVFFAAFFGAACCLSGCRQEAATPATGEHYAFAEEMFRKVWDMYRVWVLRKADNRLIISLICFIGAY